MDRFSDNQAVGSSETQDMASTPSAVKVVDINKGLLLDLTTLRNIFLRDEIKDKKVCVISIAGTFRQGKSFMLNFFIRYLTIMCKSKRQDMTKWLTSEDGPISGFSWKGGSELVTTGILIWSEVFLVEIPSGEELAVVLMDTQGSFDNVSSMKDCAAAFALSTLLSSVQIYNLMNNIKGSDLSHLQCFLSYGQLLRKTGNEVPFQNLLLLVRDWMTPEEFPYGLVGGWYLMNRVLKVGDETLEKEILTMRQCINELFKKIECFLMPHPGMKVPRQFFTGNLQDIDEDFKRQVEILANNILSLENLVPKVINGEFVKVKDLVRLFENYCKEFKGNHMPKMESLYEATMKAQHLIALEEAEEVYNTQMLQIMETSEPVEDQELTQRHQLSKQLAFEYFRAKKMIGDKKMNEKALEKLNELLERKFKEYDAINKINQVRTSEARMRQLFEEQMSKVTELEEKIAAEEEFKKLLEELQEKISQLERQLRDEQEKTETFKKKSEKSCIIL